jgi:diguanylate cyclase (GGDEF)-like protein
MFNAENETLTLYCVATTAEYQAALSSVTYTNTSINPSTNIRTLRTLVNDGDLVSNTQTREITLIRVNKVQEQNKELHYLATRDPLTGCLNRRSYSQKFEVEFNLALTQRTDLSCIMVDLDHFKRVNNNHGHGVGDTVIKLLAKAMQFSCRDEDIIGRFGGEEFCIVLPNQSIQAGLKVAERIRRGMQEECVKQFKNGPQVTTSLGVASINNNPDNPDHLNNMADEAFYEAKYMGRNRVVMWRSDMSNSLKKSS